MKNYDYAEAATKASVPEASVPESESPRALASLAEAAAHYAKVTEAFINARYEWSAARDRYQQLREVADKAISSENV